MILGVSGPRSANLLVTGTCNLSCEHCTVRSQGPLQEDMTIRQWSSVVDKLVEGRLLEATVTGGEPLCRPDIIELLQVLLRKPARINLNTNGILLSDDMIAELESLPSRFGFLMVSLDGSRPEIVDSIRGRGTYRQLHRALERLKDSLLEYGFYCTLSTKNLKDICGILGIAREHDTWIKFNPLVPSGPRIPRYLLLSPGELAKAGQILLRERREMGAKVLGTVVNCAMNLERAGQLESKENTGDGPSRSIGFGCGGGLNKLSVFPNGDATPCDHLPGVVLGNLRHQELDAVLNSPANAEFRNFVNRGRENVEGCANCECAGICLGGCPVIPYNRFSRDGRDTLSCLKLIGAGVREAGR
ncbi:MAG: radical SAM protein [Armatimonadota bacterium]